MSIEEELYFISSMKEFIKLGSKSSVLRKYTNEIKEEIILLKLKEAFSDILKKDYILDPGAKIPKTIWWCWLQGEQNAPEIVRKCLFSVYQNFSDYDIKIITESNYLDYVNIPETIIEKYKKEY